MDNNPISLTQALNHIQSWLNAGEYDKVIQGCSEILEMEPENSRALALMKMAEQRRHEATMAPSSAPQNGTPLAPNNDPLANLQVEERQEANEARPPFEAMPAPSAATSRESAVPLREEFNESLDKRKLFLAMLVPAVLVVVLGGSLIWYLADRERNETIAGNGNSDVNQSVPVDTAYLDDNEERVEQMTAISSVIEAYRQNKGKYPEADDLERILVESDEFSEVPSDPKQGEVDVEGKPFGYMYAVYDSKFGKSNQYYILSALFEDSKGVGYEWNVGESVKNYENYRDIAQDNVSFIGSSK
ncbi:hypothetical protein IPG41_02420 [Candidatus Peregrinibacteria bacterium]|nr:MAG: hypothetical protein IPG41_02420 [Candidatus Peregrinibacteria bacterium]